MEQTDLEVIMYNQIAIMEALSQMNGVTNSAMKKLDKRIDFTYDRIKHLQENK